jgi:hypothetical protein
MDEALIYCLTYLGRGNAKDWRRGADSQGGFTLGANSPYWICNYSPRGVVLKRRNGGNQVFTPAMCDAVANKIGVKQLSIF